MQKNRKLKARVLSLSLSAAMVTTMLPATVFAGVDGTAPGTGPLGTIQSFDTIEGYTKSVPFDGRTYAITVEQGTPFEDLVFPDTLTAMVARTTTAPAGDEDIVDSGKADEVIPDEDTTEGEDQDTDDSFSDNQPASPSDAEYKKIEDNKLPLSPKLEQGREKVVTTNKRETIPVEWNSNKTFTSDKNGGPFIYTAELPEDYTLADSVKLPQIYVFVGKRARSVEVGNTFQAANSDGISITYKVLTNTTVQVGTGGNQDEGCSISNDTSGTLTIPGTVMDSESKSYTVTAIGKHAFYSCDELTGFTIPDTVTSIGAGAFFGCANLAEISLPDGLTLIDADMFYACASLAEVTMPDTVTSIGNDAFSACYALAEITIPDAVTSIGNFAFAECYSFTEVIIPEAVTSIGDLAFSTCNALTEITIPSAVTSIGDSAFSECSNLAKVTVKRSISPIASLGKDAFNGTKNGLKIFVPKGTADTYKYEGWGQYEDNIQEDAGDVSVTGVTLNKSSTTLAVGGTATMKATIAPATAADKTVTWSSDNTSVATVINGVVTAAALGTANITVTTKDGNKTAICAVTVSANPPAYTATLSDGGSGASGDGSYAENTTVTIIAGSRSGYTFKNWTGSDGVIFADAESASTTFIMPANAVTVTANWTKNGSGGSSGSSSGGGSSRDTTWKSVPQAYQGKTKQIGNVIVPDYTVDGSWSKHADGNWSFTGKDGVRASNGWTAAFNPYASRGLGQSAFDWFLFDANGNMLTGWYTDAEGSTYYLNPNSDNTLGAMQTGWVLIDGKYYHFNELSDGARGKLLKNTTTPDGYYVDENGVCAERK